MKSKLLIKELKGQKKVEKGQKWRQIKGNLRRK